MQLAYPVTKKVSLCLQHYLSAICDGVRQGDKVYNVVRLSRSVIHLKHSIQSECKSLLCYSIMHSEVMSVAAPIYVDGGVAVSR